MDFDTLVSKHFRSGVERSRGETSVFRICLKYVNTRGV